MAVAGISSKCDVQKEMQILQNVSEGMETMKKRAAPDSTLANIHPAKRTRDGSTFSSDQEGEG